MSTEQQLAYEWAKRQSYPSVAARHAKTLAELIDEIEAAMCRVHLCEVCKHVNYEPSQCDCECGTCQLPCACGECLDGDRFEWAWSVKQRRTITNE